MFLDRIERALTYHPNRSVEGDLDQFGLTQNVVRDALGETISFAYRLVPAKPFLIFSHGNRGNITSYTGYFKLFEALDLSYLVFDYPGYGESSGVPSEAGLYASFRAVYDFTVTQLAIQPGQITLYGLSLGAGVTIDATAQGIEAKNQIAESPFTSTHAMAKRMLYGVPVYRSLPNRFNSLEKVSRLKVPILYIHGDQDQTTPVHHSQELFAATAGEKELYLIPGAGHTTQWEVGRDRYVNTIRDFIYR